MTPPRPEPRTAEKVAEEIVQQMIDVEAWRDNLHVNDLPFLRSQIVEAIVAARAEAYSQAFITEAWEKALKEAYEKGKAEGIAEGRILGQKCEHNLNKPSET